MGALQLIRLMQEQEGSYERFERELSDKTALYEYTVLEASGDYGMYYSVPYTNSDNIVEGCIVYPVDELFSWETKRMDGILGVPFRIDAVVLNEQIPIIKQYLYSSLFKD